MADATFKFRWKQLDLDGVLVAWNDTIGVRLARHAYLKRSGAEQEPMGAEPGRFTMRIALMGAAWASNYRALVASTRIRDYMDALGPSRVSGFADPLDVWDDEVRTERIAQIVLDALDTNGARAVADIVKVAGVPQVTIAVGNAAPTTDNWRAPDNTPQGPELAFLARVYVTQ